MRRVLPEHDTFMHFGQYRGWWHVSLSLLPEQRPLSRKLTFRDKEKIFEPARRTGASDEVMADLERTLRAGGQGTIILSLTEAQVRALGGDGMRAGWHYGRAHWNAEFWFTMTP